MDFYLRVPHNSATCEFGVWEISQFLNIWCVWRQRACSVSDSLPLCTRIAEGVFLSSACWECCLIVQNSCGFEVILVDCFFHWIDVWPLFDQKAGNCAFMKWQTTVLAKSALINFISFSLYISPSFLLVFHFIKFLFVMLSWLICFVLYFFFNLCLVTDAECQAVCPVLRSDSHSYFVVSHSPSLLLLLAFLLLSLFSLSRQVAKGGVGFLFFIFFVKWHFNYLWAITWLIFSGLVKWLSFTGKADQQLGVLTLALFWNKLCSKVVKTANTAFPKIFWNFSK